ncbi:uncharacterized protein LACBIDRAFT_309861 [Laccaria bicolor S238N-H82]|uniref:Predicted protein n=1 Tax=Laccaria bicolor (strain S238N-H82 / ATCC MYA-4686) TaxID=486041 RepID=B0DT77_LACBS|nr:uncharacterized protein LACBIDRAFT_309861 [Laccaria bicolor S238N-H82]EDR02172.1 predicted protein [Laccaria bicolor S238N-H82]|eukprot:XP_001887117.1 predicted protein [Laccaria bicolor S238N-H82]
MPPRRAKRAKLEPVVGATPSSRDVVGAKTSSDSRAVAVLPNRRSSALGLPVELLMEILSYFPRPLVGVPLYGVYFHSTPPASSLERTNLLRALSQTCQQWRLIFLSLLWERVEVCTARSQKTEAAWNLWLARSLERKSKGLAQNPQYASHVRCLNVILPRCSTATVLPAYVSCLQALPNLHTLSVLSIYTGKMTSSLKSAFEGRTFPSVQTVVVPDHVHNVLRSCPEVRRVICNFGSGTALVKAIAKDCKKVEVIEDFHTDEKMMKQIVNAAPNLRTARFPCSISPAALLLLSPLKNLVNIELRTRVLSEAALGNDAFLVNAIKMAKEVLRNREGPKSLIVRQSSDMYTPWSKNIELD